MQQLATFTTTRLRPTEIAKEASTATEVREAFFQFCAGSVPKKEVGLRMSRKGFAEDTVNLRAGLRKTSRRVYRFKFPDCGVAFVALHIGSTGES